MIEVKDLVKRYGNHLAVDHLSFTVKKGQIYGFLGPNGAGKSTTMNIMTGYLGATEGEVLINGHDILKEPEAAKKSIGYLPEMPPLYMDMTVREYLEFAAELKKISKKERRDQIDEVIKLTKLGEMRDRLIKNLSKGYRQRVGLAQAILGFPEIIILDEPTVGLDPKQIIEIRELIRKLSEKHTVILSSHILAEVREVCDYILIIADGKLVASDTPENLERITAQNETVEILARGAKQQVRDCLYAVPGVKKIVWANTEGDLIGASISVAEKRDVREKMFNTFAAAKIPLLELHTAKASLEDIFLQLTQDPEAAANALKNAQEQKSESSEGEEKIPAPAPSKKSKKKKAKLAKKASEEPKEDVIPAPEEKTDEKAEEEIPSPEAKTVEKAEEEIPSPEAKTVEKAEEAVPAPAEEAEEVVPAPEKEDNAEEIVPEPVKEETEVLTEETAREEVVEETSKEITEEVIEESAEEVIEEVTEENVEEIIEETAEKPASPIIEEVEAADDENETKGEDEDGSDL